MKQKYPLGGQFLGAAALHSGHRGQNGELLPAASVCPTCLLLLHCPQCACLPLFWTHPIDVPAFFSTVLKACSCDLTLQPTEHVLLKPFHIWNHFHNLTGQVKSIHYNWSWDDHRFCVPVHLQGHGHCVSYYFRQYCLKIVTVSRPKVCPTFSLVICGVAGVALGLGIAKVKFFF